MDFQIFYTEPALTDLKEVMRWSWRNHPSTTERFADGLLNHVDLLKESRIWVRPCVIIQASGGFNIRHYTSTIEFCRRLERSRFCISGTALEGPLSFDTAQRALGKFW